MSIWAHSSFCPGAPEWFNPVITFMHRNLNLSYDWTGSSHLVKSPEPSGEGTVSLITALPWRITLLWLIRPPSLQIITAICIFPFVCSCRFTNLWCGSHCQKANLRILYDKWWYLSESAVWDRVMTKVIPNGVCGTAGACKSVSST